MDVFLHKYIIHSHLNHNTIVHTYCPKTVKVYLTYVILRYDSIKQYKYNKSEKNRKIIVLFLLFQTNYLRYL